MGNTINSNSNSNFKVSPYLNPNSNANPVSTIYSKLFEKENLAVASTINSHTRGPSPLIKSTLQFTSNKTSLSPNTKFTIQPQNLNSLMHKKNNSNHVLEVKNRISTIKTSQINPENGLEKQFNLNKDIRTIESSAGTSNKNSAVVINSKSVVKMQTKGIPIKNFNEVLIKQAGSNKNSNSDRTHLKKSDRMSKITNFK
jgi:hypothetical protein